MTPAQQAALKWLANRDGEGVFNRHGVLLAKGELAAVMRSTWNALCDSGHVIYSANKAFKRVAVTEKGRAELAQYRGKEADTVEDDFE